VVPAVSAQDCRLGSVRRGAYGRLQGEYVYRAAFAFHKAALAQAAARQRRMATWPMRASYQERSRPVMYSQAPTRPTVAKR
jgi:hypothetical protein